MKIKNLVPALALSAVVVPATSMADVSANTGWVSEYIFRGIFQESSSAYAGVDYTTDGGFYLGTWGADVGTGLETDLYFGFAGGDNFTYKIGYTGYYYTDDFDDTYNEVNLGIGYGIFALDVAIGEWDGFGTPPGLRLHVDHDFAGGRPLLQGRHLGRRLRGKRPVPESQERRGRQRRLLRARLHLLPRRPRRRSLGDLRVQPRPRRRRLG